jgi:predicted P-loop ATPase
MIGAVARIFEPGCKVDHMLVLESGKQGTGKTSGTRALFGGDDWYADCQRSPADKDFYQDLVGKWVVEIGEMTSFTKTELGKVKQAITAQADTYRPSYGRYSRTFKRQCIFVGTTNEDSWQRDPTGGRRYLPVRVGGVDVVALARDRDQLWAEAVVRYRRGDPWWIAPAQASAEQDERYQDDPWLEPILRWLSGKADARHYDGLLLHARDKDGHVVEFTSAELLSRAVHVDTSKFERTAQTRVGVIMMRLGWKRYRPKRMGGRPWCWYPGDDWDWSDE